MWKTVMPFLNIEYMDPKLTFCKNWRETESVSFHRWWLVRIQWITQMMHQVAEKSWRCVSQLFCCPPAVERIPRLQGTTKDSWIICSHREGVSMSQGEIWSSFHFTAQNQLTAETRDAQGELLFEHLTYLFFFLLESFGNFLTFNSPSLFPHQEFFTLELQLPLLSPHHLFLPVFSQLCRERRQRFWSWTSATPTWPTASSAVTPTSPQRQNVGHQCRCLSKKCMVKTVKSKSGHSHLYFTFLILQTGVIKHLSPCSRWRKEQLWPAGGSTRLSSCSCSCCFSPSSPIARLWHHQHPALMLCDHRRPQQHARWKLPLSQSWDATLRAGIAMKSANRLQSSIIY